MALRGAAQREDRGGAQAVENPADEDYAADELGEFSGASQYRGPDTQRDDCGGGSSEARVDLGEFLEEEIVVGHGVEHARRGEDDASWRR